MKIRPSKRAVLIGLPGLVLMSSTQAATPVWTFTPVQGFPNSVTVGATGTATVKYTVTNQSHRTHTLVMKPIQGITSSGCTSALGYLQSCTLNLEISGTALSGDVTSGPVLCDQGNALECYQPSSINSLRVIKGQNVDRPMVAVGQYVDGSTSRPLLALSQDSGVAWSYPESITDPTFISHPYISSGTFNSASSTGSTFIAVGRYWDGSTFLPLLALSQDTGATWTYPESLTAPVFTPTNSIPFFDNGNYTSSSCSGNTCIAAGYYREGAPTFSSHPLLALSQNSGTTWTYPEAISVTNFTPPNTNPYTDSGNFSGASCSGTTCIAVGSYFGGGQLRPLLAVSQDSGTAWIYPDSITSPVLTTYPFNQNGYFASASCSGNICIAAGGYDDGSTGRPLLALSQNSGATWTYPDSITNPIFVPNTFLGGGFTGASCSGSTCIAVGNYTDGSNGRPLLALSQDSGTTWTYPVSITEPVFIQNPFDGGGFTSASCSGSTCIAVGQYLDGTIARPLLAVSQNSGVTWTYPESITAPVFTPNNTNPFSQDGIFNSASCNGSTCMAAGQYNDGFVDRPLVAVSNDSGATWTYPNSVNAPIFTPNNTNSFVGGGIFNGANVGGSLLSKSLQFLIK